jgi:hypothetical protein
MKIKKLTLRLLLLAPVNILWLGSPDSHGQIMIDRQITIQPIQISNGSTLANPNLTLFETEADQIWSQAQIDIKFLPAVIFTSSTFYNLSSSAGDANSLNALVNVSGAGQNADSHVINLWFVHLINGSSSVLGFTLQSQFFSSSFTLTQNGIAISDSSFTINGGKGASDTIAHEIGHSLALNHSTFGAIGQFNLMSSTTFPPNGILDIYPAGNNYDQLTAAQIAQARSVTDFVLPITPFAFTPVPEPSTNFAVASFLALTGIYLCRKSKTATAS